MGCCQGKNGGTAKSDGKYARASSPKADSKQQAVGSVRAQPPRREVQYADVKDPDIRRRTSQIKRKESTIRRRSSLLMGGAMPLPPDCPKMVGEYTVTAVLREGGTAQLYVGQDPDCKDWCLKRFKKEEVEQDDTIWKDYVLQKIVSGHPNVVSVRQDLIETGRHLFVIMEFVKSWQLQWKQGQVVACGLDFGRRQAVLGCNGNWSSPHGIVFRDSGILKLPTDNRGSLQPLLPFVRGRGGVKVRVNFGKPEFHGAELQYPMPPGWGAAPLGVASIGGEPVVIRGEHEVGERFDDTPPGMSGVLTLGASKDADKPKTSGLSYTGAADVTNSAVADGDDGEPQFVRGDDALQRLGLVMFEVNIIAAPPGCGLAIGWATESVCDDTMQNEVYVCDGFRNMRAVPEGTESFMLGNDVDDLLCAGPLPMRLARRWYRDLAAGLAHCHKNGIAHRDVKGQNLFVCGQTGVAKLGDFGSGAKAAGNQKCSEVLGTLGKIAPELFAAINEGEGYWALPADVWSSGVLLWEMLTGEGLIQSPWEDAQDIQKIGNATLRFRIERLPPEKRKLFADLPEGAQSLLKSVLADNPSRRPTAEAILADPWLVDEPHADLCRELGVQFVNPFAVARGSAGKVPEMPAKRRSTLVECHMDGSGVSTVKVHSPGGSPRSNSPK